MATTLRIATSGKGLYEITDQVREVVSSMAVDDGVCVLFVQHTSASLVIQENADSSARRDLEDWMARIVPEGQPEFTHTDEGPDDMPSHIRAMLTDVSLSIPIVEGRLALGTWQGIFLFEHRSAAHDRRIVVQVTRA
jgi:secondary thiamine-phosphate synthase enzyme